MSKANGNEDMAKAAAPPPSKYNPRPGNIIEATDASRAVIRGDEREWDKDEVANLDDVNYATAKPCKIGLCDAKESTSSSNDDNTVMGPPPPRPPKVRSGLRPGWSVTKGEKRDSTNVTGMKKHVDKRLKDIKILVPHKNMHAMSDPRVTSLRIFIRHDLVPEGRSNWEISWECIAPMKQTDPYLIVRQSNESEEIIEHHNDLLVSDTKQLIDLCEYVEEEKAGVKYIISIISELALNQLRELGTPTHTFLL